MGLGELRCTTELGKGADLPWATQPCLQESHDRRLPFPGEKQSHWQCCSVQRIACKRNEYNVVV